MSKTLRNLIALGIAILPINGIMIWYRLSQTENFSTGDMTVYPMIFGGGSILLMLLLNRYLLRDTFKTTFNAGQGSVQSDIFVGLVLTTIYFVMFFLERATLYQWFPGNNGHNTELIDVLLELANSPWLILFWFGPVLWIGIALFEEMSRVFLLKCLWSVSENKNWQIVVIFLASALIGTVHLYQGMAGIISIGLNSMVVCFYFYKYRRLLPLVISHGLYDGLQFAFFIMQIS